MREAGRGRPGRGRMLEEDNMKGVTGCDGLSDTPEMIQRCLNCTRETCRGEESCAAGRPLITVPVGQGRVKGYAARLAAAGMSVRDIAKKLNRTQREVRSWL